MGLSIIENEFYKRKCNTTIRRFRKSLFMFIHLDSLKQDLWECSSFLMSLDRLFYSWKRVPIFHNFVVTDTDRPVQNGPRSAFSSAFDLTHDNLSLSLDLL